MKGLSEISSIPHEEMTDDEFAQFKKKQENTGGYLHQIKKFGIRNIAIIAIIIALVCYFVKEQFSKDKLFELLSQVSIQQQFSIQIEPIEQLKLIDPTISSPLAQMISKRVKNSQNKYLIKEREQAWHNRQKVFKSKPQYSQYSIFNFKINNDRDKEEIDLFKNDYEQMQKKYEVSKYKQLPICIISPGYNNNKDFRIQKNLNSLFLQNYTNYRVIVTDDASTDGSAQIIEKYLEFYNIGQERAIFAKNKIRKYSGQTMYKAITTYCNKRGITVSVDGDDELIGRNVFKMINAVYQKQKLGVMWTAFYNYNQNNNILKLSNNVDYTEQQKKQMNFRYYNNYHHLKTFRTQLFHLIPLEDMVYEDGTFIKFATDVVFYQPMLEIACGKIKGINQFQYLYNIGTGNNEVGRVAYNTAQTIFAKPKLPCWQYFKQRIQTSDIY